MKECVCFLPMMLNNTFSRSTLNLTYRINLNILRNLLYNFLPDENKM